MARVVSDASALLEQDYDTPAGRRPGAVLRSYVVCSTPRSGSGLLCRALASTGVAGAPTEYFNPVNRSSLAERWGCRTELGAYVSAVCAQRTGANGVFGTKLHWEQFEQLRAEMLGLGRAEPEFEISSNLLEELLPRPRYIHIVRRDVNRQAVSFWTALQTGVWSQSNDAAGGGEAPPVPYSFEGIDRCRRLIENAEVHWDRFFRFNAIEPFDVVYEELDAAYERTVGAVLRHALGDDGSADVTLGERPSRRLGSEHSQALLDRFAADRELRGLDDPLVPSAAELRVAELERELGVLTASRSWRLTRPLRALRGTARRLG